jgi:hypothetical protein
MTIKVGARDGRSTVGRVACRDTPVGVILADSVDIPATVAALETATVLPTPPTTGDSS